MRRVKIFAGSSHPVLVEAICERLGTSPAQCELGEFSNGETSVNINTSIRDQDVFVVQSSSPTVNDAIMEMLILISACKGGSARSICAVMPYFPYSRQSKKKSHRGAITARLLANLLSVAGIDHVITIDLHAPPTQGFFGKPVDNLHALPLISRWIRSNVAGWRDGVVVSKNPGGTKRVTALADALKLNFGLVTTDRRRMPVANSLEGSGIFDRFYHQRGAPEDIPPVSSEEVKAPRAPSRSTTFVNGSFRHLSSPPTSSPLVNSTRLESASPPTTRRPAAVDATPKASDSEDEEYNDERVTEVVTGRLIHGHIVDDEAASPALSAISNAPSPEDRDPMTLSFTSNISRFPTEHNALGGSIDPTEHSDNEEEELKDPGLEHTVTLVGDVRGRVVFIIDDLIDQAGSWIAAAETVIKRGEAKSVYCIATHGLFGDKSLEEMEACECISHIVVTNSCPLAEERVRSSKKLIVLDISNLLSEAIRRTHFGDSLAGLFQHYPD